jgi:hypothetical protein
MLRFTLMHANTINARTHTHTHNRVSHLDSELLLRLVSSHRALRLLSRRCHLMLCSRLTAVRCPASAVLLSGEEADYGNNLYIVVQVSICLYTQYSM